MHRLWLKIVHMSPKAKIITRLHIDGHAEQMGVCIQKIVNLYDGRIISTTTSTNVPYLGWLHFTTLVS